MSLGPAVITTAVVFSMVAAGLVGLRAHRLALFAGIAALSVVATWRQLQRPVPVPPSQGHVPAELPRSPMPAVSAVYGLGEPYPFDACLEAAPERWPGGAIRLRLVTMEGTRVDLAVSSGPLDASIQPGNCFRIKAALLPVPNREGGFRNPGASRPLADMARGAIYRATIASTRALVRLQDRRPQPLASYAFALTLGLGRALDTIKQSHGRGLLKALVTGDRSELPEAATRAFSELGVVHVLSVSGLHLAVVAAALYQVLVRVLGRWHYLACRIEPRRLASLVVIPSAWAYTLVTGSAVATRRAAWMATHHFLGLVLGQSPCLLSSLGLAATIELGADPLVLFDPSFQLSFAATLGLIARVGIRRNGSLDLPTTSTLSLPGRMGGALVNTMTATLRATLFTLPFSAWYFYHLPWASPISNLLIVPICELVLLPGALGGLLLHALFRPAGNLVLRLLGGLATHLIHFATGVAQLFPTLWIGQPPWPSLAMFALFIASLSTRRLRLAGVCLMGALAFAIMPRLVKPPFSAHFIDVGQGDAIFFELPGGRTMLVDGGGSVDSRFDPGRLSLVPFLRRRGVSTLDYLVLSHPHPDHMGGLIAVAEGLDIGEVWTSGEEVASPTFERLHKLLLEKGISPRRPRKLAWDYRGRAVRVETLAPLGGVLPTRSINDNSVVLRVSYGPRRLLLTGDIERQTEAELLAAGADLATDVLKVPHHGSRTSSTQPFLLAARPRIAIACAGRNNRFGFPHQEVAERYTCPLCITGKNGAVELSIEGDGTLAVTPLLVSPACPASTALAP